MRSLRALLSEDRGRRRDLRVDEDAFAIYAGDGSVLDEEQVTTGLTPDGMPFRPGDLDLSEPLTYPTCDGAAVAVLGSWQSEAGVDQLVQQSLDIDPGIHIDCG